jgi:hypothetical protein
VTVVQAADRICGSTRVNSSAVADQSNCGPGHDAMSGWWTPNVQRNLPLPSSWFSLTLKNEMLVCI